MLHQQVAADKNFVAQQANRFAIQVPQQRSLGVELLTANVALVQTLPRVRFRTMRFEGALVGEPIFTNVAGESILSGRVQTRVFGEVASFHELATADLAHEILHPQLGHYVILEALLKSETLTAVVANERFLFGVHPHVLLHVHLLHHDAAYETHHLSARECCVVICDHVLAQRSLR